MTLSRSRRLARAPEQLRVPFDMTKLDYTNATNAPSFRDKNELHIWRIDLGADGSMRSEWLPADEVKRAESYRRPADASRYLAARTCLRKVLGMYLHVPARHVRFVYNETGKPGLDRRFHDDALHFNMSRSRDIAIVGVSKCGAVGVDIEFIDPDFPFFCVAEKYFTPSTVERLRQLPSDLARSIFFDLWTRIEAYGKGKGEGLSEALHLNYLIPGDLGSKKVLPGEEWSVVNIFADENYAAAVASKEPASCFRHCQMVAAPAAVRKVSAAAVSGEVWQS
jgi:4'-phosphopantetheinyl transferase